MGAKTFNNVKINLTLKTTTTRANLSTSSEDLAVQLGKIKKWYDDFAWSAFTAPTVEVTGSGNAITSASWSTSTGKLTLTKGSTFLTSATQYIKEIAQSGSGNAVTSLSVSGGKLTYTLGSTFLTQHPAIVTQTDTTSTSAPSFGGTFTAVDSVTRDSNGHVTKINTKTVTIPNKTMGAATSSAAGSIGLVPAPAAGKQTSFLRGDGTWVIPTNSTYTAGTGLALSGSTFNHSNSVTAVTTASLLKFKYDAQGHITGSSAATSSDLPSHTHYEQDVKFDTSYSYKPQDDVRFPSIPQPLINTMRTNKFVFLPSSSITIEHSTDGGSTYTDSGYTDTGKCNIFTSRQIGSIYIGPNTTAERTTSMRTMVTITRDSRYTRIDRFYIWFSTSGHNAYVDIQYATNAADTTWVDWRTNIQLLGWSGPNLINGPVLVFGASDTHVKKIRFIFRYTGIRENYKTSPSRIFEIAAYSDYPAWTATNNMMMNDHLYYWDKDQIAYFPAEIKVPTQLRVHNGNYGALFRTDGTNTHILLTNSGEAESGSWNSLRPFSINNSAGWVTMSEGLKVNTKDGAFLEIHGLTTTSYAYGSSSPKIRFTNSPSDQNAELIWDDHDTYCTPASLTLIGNQDGTYFIAPRIRLDSSSTTQAFLDFNDANDKGAYLRYSTSTRSYGNIIAMLPYTVDGIGVVFNHTGGGYCCIGAGESPSNFTTAVMSTDKNPYGTTAWAYGSEQMCITADNSIYFVSGANGLNTTNHTDWTNLRTAIFDANGYFKPSVNLNGSIGTAGNRWLSMYAKRYFGRLSQQVNLTRQTTANLACEGTMSMQLIQATSSMTTGKPALDGYILDFDWDNTGPYKAQLSIPDAAAGSIQWRPQAGYANWDNDANIWRYVHDNTKGVGKTGFLAYPTDGSYYEQTTQNVTGALVITLPFAKTNGQCMIHFSVDIYNYTAGQSVTYVIAGYCYNDEKWYSCTAYALGRAMSDFNNLVVRFGCVTGGKYKIQIGETTTVWKYPQVSIRDVTVGYKRAQDQTTYAENIGNWTVTFESSNIANVTQTIAYTMSFLPFDVATGSADANTFLDRTGWFNWNTNTGSNMPTTNWGILLSKRNPSLQVFIPDNAGGIYFRRRSDTSSTPTAWWGITGTAGVTYNLANMYKVSQSETTTANYRALLLGYNNSTSVSSLTTAVDNVSYVTSKLYAQPSTGNLYMDGKCTIGKSSNSSYPTGGIHVHDVRNLTVTPDVAVGKSANFYFHQYTCDGTNNYWWGVLNVRGWDGAYSSWELAGPSQNVDQRTTPLYVRTSNTNSAWGNWRKIYDTANPPTYSEVGAAASSHTHSSLNVGNVGGKGIPIYFSSGTPTACSTPASGAWWSTSNALVPQISTSGVLEIGRYIDLHATAASTNNFDYRFEAVSTKEMMLSSTGTDNVLTLNTAGYNQIRFKTTATNKSYTALGIVSYPLSASGQTMLFQCGGNMVIGGGEFASAAYARKDSTGATQVGYDDIVTTEREKLYLGADTEVQIIANAQNLGTYSNNDHVVWKFQTTGQLITPAAITDTLDLQHTMIHQSVRSASNCVTFAQWIVDGAASTTYRPSISFHNTGGDSTDKGAIILSPYHHNTDPWGKNVGLYIGKNILRLDGVNVALQNAASLNTMINALSTGTSAPVDADYYVSQYAGGGTSTTTYHRRPVSALYSYIRSKHIKSAVVIQTGSSKKAKITLQTLMAWLITTKKYIPSGTTEDIIIKPTWAYANNDILRFTANGINYEMSLAGVIIEFKGLATSYNAGEFTFTITSAPTVISDTPTSGYTRFPANTTAVYHCNGSSYSPTWTVNMNKAVQQLLYQSTTSVGYGYAEIVIGSVFSNWTILWLEFMGASYGQSSSNPHSGAGLIPLSLVKSIGVVSAIADQYHIPIGYNPGNTTADQYLAVGYMDDNTFSLSRGGGGGPIGKVKIYGIC